METTQLYGDYTKLGGGNSNNTDFHPSFGIWSNLINIFSNGLKPPTRFLSLFLVATRFFSALEKMIWAKCFFETSNFSLLSKVVTFREFSLGWSEANIGGEVCPVASRWLSAPFVLEFSAKKIPTKRWSEAFQSLKSESTLEPQVLKFGDYKKLWSFISYIASFLPKHHSCFSGKKRVYILKASDVTV